MHGDDFTFCGIEEDLFRIRRLMRSWFDIEFRTLLSLEEGDDKEAVLLGRIFRQTEKGIGYKAPTLRVKILEYFGMDQG